MDGTLTSYRAALDYLFARTGGGSKFGLERTEALLCALGAPQRRFASVHIAGTNGKGSSAAVAEAVLRAKGLRVGKYTSPHLVDFRERVVVDGRPIPAAVVTEFVDRWTPLVEEVGATFFEATTAMAFDWFARREADVVVVEAGLGGRLDATNVIQPRAAGVTSIGYDHTEYLGATLEEIAAEKAGIFKPGVPAVVGERDPSVRALLAELARGAKAAPVRVVADETEVAVARVSAEGTEFTLSGALGARRLRTPLAGEHQAANAALALTMLDAAGPGYALPADEAAQALRRVRLPGRFHRAGRFIFDVAHNPDGARVLAATLCAVGPERPVLALLSVLGDKDWRGIMAALAGAVHAFLLTTAPTAPASRAWRLDEALAHAQASGWRAEAEADFDRALARAEAWPGTVLVTGSFHTAGDAMARLQINPLGA